MENKSHSDGHDRSPQDEATKNKIDKHLRDEKDTISEEDLKNINTDIKPEEPVTTAADKTDDEPKKEMPSSWEIIDE